MRQILIGAFTATLFSFGCIYASSQALPVELKYVRDESKVEIWVDGDLFTVYQYGPAYKDKPVFYPVFSPSGTSVVREIPFDNQELRKSQDHHHHQSVFMGYGDVDGKDFWSSRKGERIVHRGMTEVTDSFTVLLEWLDGEGISTLDEIRRVEFGATADSRWMDHTITLLPKQGLLHFSDTKEGMFAIRLADELREDEGTGRYINAFGWETSNEIWGKRAPWVAIRGSVEDKDVTVAIFEHPSTENHPSYWHARAYGLFAVNPFGRKDFVKGSTPLDTVLPANGSLRFRYRIVIYTGKVSKERLDQDYWAYIN
jgi:hypothetical protein